MGIEPPRKLTPSRESLTILPIDTNGYILSQNSAEAGGEFHNHGSRARPQQSRVDSCLRTIVRRLPNLSAPKELPAAQPSACCRPKAWFHLSTGSRWKSTQLSVSAYAEHKPLLAGDHF
jgi:hypothetical protein